MVYSQESFLLRTGDSFIENGSIGNEIEPCYGILGPTIISEYVDLSYTPLDYMHLICLGIF